MWIVISLAMCNSDDVVAIRFKIDTDKATYRFLHRHVGESFIDFEQRFLSHCFARGYVLWEYKYVCEYEAVQS